MLTARLIEMDGDSMNITVYLGSSEGSRGIYREAAAQLGRWIGSNGHRLIYGGSENGLMGTLANAVLETGGEVIGVEPQFFLDAGFEHPGLTKLIATKDMSERKASMLELGDAFIAFPGGFGTLEEIAEIISLYNLRRIDKPYVLYNLEGFYEPLLAFFDHMVQEGFVTPENRGRIRSARTIDEIASIITH